MLGTSNQFSTRLLRWYRRNRRDLPWRVPLDASAGTTPPPYYVFVSEAMLQQTQVATVVPYFQRFIERFPTMATLAQSTEQEVLRFWQGLGYYSRARNLRNAAIKVMQDFDGQLPPYVDALLQLPGVGRYTAGAIASLGFHTRAPILDGNVARVLCRIDKIEADPREKATSARLWRRAEAILPRHRTGDFNSALMELGATVCMPRNPQCLTCPIKQHCESFAAAVQDLIPPIRKSKPTPLHHRWTFCIRRGDRWLIEQRPSTGRWAGMWQFVTITPGGDEPSADILTKAISLKATNPQRIATITHTLTHRRYQFEVFRCSARNHRVKPAEAGRTWVHLDELERYPLPKPHVTIASLLREAEVGHKGVRYNYDRCGHNYT